MIDIITITIASAALVISIGSLWAFNCASNKSLNEQKRLNDHRISHDKRLVRPRVLSSWISEPNATVPVAMLQLKNVGLGPALLGPPYLITKGKTIPFSRGYKQEIQTGLTGLGLHEHCSLLIVNSDELKGLPAGQTRKVIWVEGSSCRTFAKWFSSQHEKNLVIIIPYTTIYEDEILFTGINYAGRTDQYPREILKKLFPKASNLPK